VGAYDFSVVNSSWMEAQFAGYPERYRQRTRRIDHGVDVPSILPDRQASRMALGVPDNAFVMVSTGRLTEGENQRVLVEALTELPETHLVLAGAGPEGERIAETARLLGVDDRLHRLGEVTSAGIHQVLAAGDVFAFASRTETFGLSAAEAAIAGLPVVANDIAVLREVLADAAIYVDAEQGSAVANAVKRLVAEPGKMAAMATAGRSLRARYAPERMCAAYEGLLSA
jgi:glycosyltransferase involved in cell wall biosynthesis